MRLGIRNVLVATTLRARSTLRGDDLSVVIAELISRIAVLEHAGAALGARVVDDALDQGVLCAARDVVAVAGRAVIGEADAGAEAGCGAAGDIRVERTTGRAFGG